MTIRLSKTRNAPARYSRYQIIEPVIFATQDRADLRFEGCFDSPLFLNFLPRSKYEKYIIIPCLLKQLKIALVLRRYGRLC